MEHQELLDIIMNQIRPLEDLPVNAITYGGHVAAVESRTMGLATWAWGHHPVPLEDLPDPAAPVMAKELASLIYDKSPLRASLGMAAVNSMLPDVREDLLADINAGDLLLKFGSDKRVAVIGHFPFVESMKTAFKELMVFEKKPHPGDLAEASIPDRLPEADVVAVTATTLANKTLAHILSHCSDRAVRIIVGPSTPLCTGMFEMGFDYVAGSIVVDRPLALSCIRQGTSFKFVKGIRHVIMDRSAA